MYGFQTFANDDPLLRLSPLITGIAKTLAFVKEHGHIELTKSGFFKRSFVNWAAAEFNWPGYSERELFRMSKVLNEPDFLPLYMMHPFLVHLKLGRHFKGTFRLTKTGALMVGRPGEIFSFVAEPFLLDLNHGARRTRDEPPGNPPWPIIFNILNIEAETGISCERAGELFYPQPSNATSLDMRYSDAFISVLRPLCWLGLLQEHKEQEFYSSRKTIFTKTPLWRAALRLETDKMIKPLTLH